MALNGRGTNYLELTYEEVLLTTPVKSQRILRGGRNGSNAIVLVLVRGGAGGMIGITMSLVSLAF